MRRVDAAELETQIEHSQHVRANLHAIKTLEAELADVKAENEKYRQWHSNGRANIEFTKTGVRLCEGDHPSYAPCVWIEYIKTG